MLGTVRGLHFLKLDEMPRYQIKVSTYATIIICMLAVNFCGCFSTGRSSRWLATHQNSPFHSESGVGRSIAQLQNQLEHVENAPELNVELGNLFLESGQLLPASRQVDLALQQRTDLAGAWMLRGDIATEKGKHSEALAAYQHAISLGGDKTRLLKSIAHCYIQQKRPMRAAATLENLLPHSQGDIPADVLRMYCDVMCEVGQHSQAIFALRQACTSEQGNVENYLQLSKIQSQIGDHRASKETLRMGSMRFPESDLLSKSMEHFANRDAELAVR